MRVVSGLICALALGVKEAIAAPASPDAAKCYGPPPPASVAAYTAHILPDLQRQADDGTPHAECMLLQLYSSCQATPRKKDDLATMRRDCGFTPYGSPGHPPPPGITVH